MRFWYLFSLVGLTMLEMLYWDLFGSIVVFLMYLMWDGVLSRLYRGDKLFSLFCWLLFIQHRCHSFFGLLLLYYRPILVRRRIIMHELLHGILWT